MKIFLSRLWKLKASELGVILTLGFVILSNSIAQKVAEISSISGFVSNVGVDGFLILLIVSSVISILTTAIQSFLIDRFNRLSLLCNTALVMGAAFLILRILLILKAPGWISYSFFYLLCEQQFTFFPLFFWLLANDLFNVYQTKRIFPLLSAWSFSGDLLGIGIATISPYIFFYINTKFDNSPINVRTDEVAILINIIIYALIYITLRIRLNYIKIREIEYRSINLYKTISEGWNFVKKVPSFRYVTVSIVAFAICEVIVEFSFYVNSTNTFPDSDSYQTFLGIFTLIRLLAYVAIQGFLTQRVIASVGLKNIFLVQPFSGIAGIILMLVTPGLTGSIVGVLLQKVPQYSIAETARKALQGFVPEERRGRVSLLLDSYLIAGGTVLSASITYLIIKFGSRYFTFAQTIQLSLLIALVTAAIAIWSVLKMRSTYEISLLNWRLKRRQRNHSTLDKLDP